MEKYNGMILVHSAPDVCHYGIKGQKKGVRRYQLEDGTLTTAGKYRYGIGIGGTNTGSTPPNPVNEGTKASEAGAHKVDNQYLKETADIVKRYKQGKVTRKELAYFAKKWKLNTTVDRMVEALDEYNKKSSSLESDNITDFNYKKLKMRQDDHGGLRQEYLEQYQRNKDNNVGRNIGVDSGVSGEAGKKINELTTASQADKISSKYKTAKTQKTLLDRIVKDFPNSAVSGNTKKFKETSAAQRIIDRISKNLGVKEENTNNKNESKGKQIEKNLTSKSTTSPKNVNKSSYSNRLENMAKDFGKNSVPGEVGKSNTSGNKSSNNYLDRLIKVRDGNATDKLTVGLNKSESVNKSSNKQDPRDSYISRISKDFGGKINRTRNVEDSTYKKKKKK